MSENELLLLGLLVHQSQHGYQINEFIEKELSHITDMKKGNAYATLDRMTRDGLVNVRHEQEGNRPQRKVYSITPQGESEFYRLLRQNLSNAENMLFSGDVGLMFLDNLPVAEVAALLEQRLAQLQTRLNEYEKTGKHEHGLGVDLAVDHVIFMLQAEAGWLTKTIPYLKTKAAGPAQETVSQ